MLKTILGLIPESWRKRLAIAGVAIIAALVLWALCSGGEREPVPSVQSITERQTYETQRTERIIQLIDERKEAEQDAAKNKPIADDDVLNVLGGLLDGQSGRDAR